MGRGKVKEEGLPDVLAIMRHVSTEAGGAGEGELMKKYRLMFEEDFKEFSKRLEMLERDWMLSETKRIGVERGGVMKVKDIGKDRAVALCVEFLKERGKEGKANG